MSQVTNLSIPDSPLMMTELQSTLEAIFAALNSIHSGATPPSSAVEPSFWFDTSGTPTYILKCYTTTGGWISIFSVNITKGALSFYRTGGTALASAFALTLLDDDDASTALSTLGITTYIKTLLDDADAGAALTTLGLSAFVKTLVDAADASAFRTLIGAEYSAQPLLHVVDRKALNTAGGTFTTGAWRTRDLNVVMTNEIEGSLLASNQITLPAGTYFIEAKAPGFAVNVHKARLYNTTTDAQIIESLSCNSNTLSPENGYAVVAGKFTLSGESVLELQHYCSRTVSTDGFGYPTNIGSYEYYSDVKIYQY